MNKIYNKSGSDNYSGSDKSIMKVISHPFNILRFKILNQFKKSNATFVTFLCKGKRDIEFDALCFFTVFICKVAKVSVFATLYLSFLKFLDGLETVSKVSSGRIKLNFKVRQEIILPFTMTIFTA